MAMQTREWNVVATMAILITFAYVGICAAALFLGKVDFAGFAAAVGPIAGTWIGYIARMLGEAQP